MPLIPQFKRKAFFDSPLVKVAVVCIIILVVIAVGQLCLKAWTQFLSDPEFLFKGGVDSKAVEIVIPQGASTNDVALILKEKKVIRFSALFRTVSKMTHNDGKYMKGLYLLSPSMSYQEIMGELQKNAGKNGIVRFTIPEGYELRQIADKLADMKIIDRNKFMDAVENGNFDYPFLKDIPKRKNRLEGYLYPDTYEVFPNAGEQEIIKKMLDRFGQVFDAQYVSKAKSMGMTVDQIITLASMVEREAKLDKERPIIAAVFYNRLKSKNYRLLQSCATVEYILKERKPILSIQDTRIDSPYNTYMYPGLPVGPIASPGKPSIDAALNPANVDYLFFVANSDGSHTFSKTYEEHQQAIKNVK